MVLFTAVSPRKSNIHNYSFVKSLNKANEFHDNKNPEHTGRQKLSYTENYFLPSVDAVPLDWVAICDTLERESKNENAAWRTSDNIKLAEQQGEKAVYQCYQFPRGDVTIILHWVKKHKEMLTLQWFEVILGVYGELFQQRG